MSEYKSGILPRYLNGIKKGRETVPQEEGSIKAEIMGLLMSVGEIDIDLTDDDIDGFIDVMVENIPTIARAEQKSFAKFKEVVGDKRFQTIHHNQGDSTFALHPVRIAEEWVLLYTYDTTETK